MNRPSLLVGFVLGFAAATIIGLTVVLPMSRRAWAINVDSDVHRPLEGALQYIENAAAHGDCARAAAQLHVLNTRFAEYRAGGTLPAQWYQQVIATTTRTSGSGD